MRKMKIVADSSANILALPGFPFASAPLKIITAEREFVDDQSLDAAEMVAFFDDYKGKSKTSCPNPSDWLEAFGDADDIFCVTITSGLSGSYNAACAAKNIYEGEHEGRRVAVIDSLSTGPEMVLLVEKIQELAAAGNTFADICQAVQAYSQQTGLLFMLESLKNFAANGRVSPAVAKLTGFLGIRVVGRASDKGQLEPLSKCRGEARSLETILTHLQNAGLCQGKVHIAHCQNPTAASRLVEMLHDAMPAVTVTVSQCRGLCCYYAEKGGLLVGFEKM